MQHNYVTVLPSVGLITRKVHFFKNMFPNIYWAKASIYIWKLSRLQINKPEIIVLF